MITIQKHVISEAFERLGKVEGLNESIKSDLMRLFKAKGFDVTRKDVLNYIDAAEEYIEIARDQTGEDYSVQDWYKETKTNYPEDLRALKKDLDESKLTEKILDKDVYTIGIYGDEIPGFNSVKQFIEYLERKGLKIHDFDGNMDYGWDITVSGPARILYNEINNKIPGYHSASIDDFFNEYSLDEIDESVKESKFTERYSFPEVDDALNHFWNDLGKDPEVDDVIGYLEREYPDWVPDDPDKYGRWYHDVAGEISARLSESKLTESYTILKFKTLGNKSFYDIGDAITRKRIAVNGKYHKYDSYKEAVRWLKSFIKNGDLEDDGSLEELDESKLTEARKPKYWNSMFATKVIDAYNNKELTQKNIDEWETKYNGGKKPNPSLGTKEILNYYIKTKKDPRLEESIYVQKLIRKRPKKDNNGEPLIYSGSGGRSLVGLNYGSIDKFKSKEEAELDLKKTAKNFNEWEVVKLDESRLTEAPLTPAEYAAKARARKSKKDSEEENGESILYKINAKLDPDMSVTDQLQVYFDELVPPSGPAKTIAGELVRAIMRILYRDYNDGDLWYTGYGEETCGDSVIYLVEHIEDLQDLFDDMIYKEMENEEYTEALEEVASRVMVYLNEHPELFTTPLDKDSRSYSDSLESYFDLPKYEFDPDTSYDDSYYDVSDDDIDQFIHDVVESDFRGATVNRWAADGWTIEDLDKEQLEYLEDVWDKWFRDFLSQYEREEEPEEDEEEYYDEDDE